MNLSTQRNGPLRDSNSLAAASNRTAQSTSDKLALSGSGSDIGQSGKTKMLTSSSNSSAKSAKMCVNFSKMFVDGTPADKKNSRTTTLRPKPYQRNVSLGDNDKRCADGMSINSDNNDYLYPQPRRLSGGFHHNTTEKLIVSPSQCKQRPAGLKFVDSKEQVNVIHLQLNDNQIKTNVDGLMPTQAHKSRTRATQTLFRESSAQTLPYLPGVSNDPEELENLEIFKLPTILPGDGPPGLYEVEVLERARRRWAFAKALKENFRKQLEAAKEQAKLQNHEHILEAFEWEHWIEREEYIQECQMLRLELLIRMFDKREKDMHEASKSRIQKSCEEIEARRKAALKKNDIEYNRALRRLEIKHNKQPRVWRKEEITQELGDPSSEFYAPKMRYGVNPSRRHFTASRKAFNMRMDDLEKRAIKIDPKNLKCPFAKLREWSKPKEVLQEVEQNFCSDANLKRLYESLRTLRESSRKQKYTPLCLKAKELPKPSALELNTKGKTNKVLQIHITDEAIEKQKSNDTSSRASFAEEVEHKEDLRKLREEKQAERLKMEMLQKEMRNEELETLLNSYEGNTIGWLMRFLSEEMCRLKEQRKLHFFTMLAKRERWHREAAEAGLRQKENCVRDVYENLYEKCDQTYKEMADKFLHSIFEADIKDYAHQKAEHHVSLMAKELDKEISSWLESFAEVQNPLNYHTLRHALKDIVIPDIRKTLNRWERDDCIKYIINDVLLSNVYCALEPYDVSFEITNDFVDRLIDNDLYLDSIECSSDCSEACQEAKAIMRKVIRYAVPGRRWRTEEERLAFENISDLLDNIFEKAITQRAVFDVDMTKPPHVSEQASHTDLVDTDKDLTFKVPSEEQLSSEYVPTAKRLEFTYESIVPDFTRNLKSSEIFLLMDPDKLSSDSSLLNIGEYTEPEPKLEPRFVHLVPSTHKLECVMNFKNTPIFAQTSSEELLEIIESDEHNTLEESFSHHEDIEEPSESRNQINEPKEVEADLEEEIEVEAESIESVKLVRPSLKTHDKLVTQSVRFVEEPEKKIIEAEPKLKEEKDERLDASAVHFVENPKENIFEVEPKLEEEEDDAGFIEVAFSYNPEVKYSVPVPSNYDISQKENADNFNESDIHEPDDNEEN